jgi:hypothetical protein
MMLSYKEHRNVHDGMHTQTKPYHTNFTTMLMLGRPHRPPFSSTRSLP